MDFFDGIVWDRPAGLLALALPFVVLLLSLRKPRPLPLAVGTFALWQGCVGNARGERRRWHVPLWTWLVSAGLTSGALALAAPRRATPPSARTWRVLVDRTPSMYLEHAAGGTRLAAARRALLERLDVRSDDVVKWAGADDASALHATFPEAWTSAPNVQRPEVDWAAFDEAGTVWLTDVAPPIEARSAGWLAIGGSAVPGPVAQFGTTVTRWTGSAFESQADGAPAPVVVCDAGVPGAIRQLVDAWAGERGWQLAAGSAAERARLVVRHLPDADATDRALRAYRDGWSLVGRGALAAARGTTDVWLAAADGRALVGTAPGLVTIGLREIESIGGELASFAVAWSRLLDERALAPLGVVPWSERQAAGELAWQAPSASAARAPAAPDRYPLAWQLACAAALLAALGLALRGGLTNFPLRAAPAARTMKS